MKKDVSILKREKSKLWRWEEKKINFYSHSSSSPSSEIHIKLKQSIIQQNDGLDSCSKRQQNLIYFTIFSMSTAGTPFKA
jgi:hypothetical protein